MSRTLRIHTTDLSRDIDVVREDVRAANLFQAWDRWRAAERGSNRESHLWNRVLDIATDYVAEYGYPTETADDVREVEA